MLNSNLRLKNLRPIIRKQNDSEGTKKDRLVAVLTDVLKSICKEDYYSNDLPTRQQQREDKRPSTEFTQNAKATREGEITGEQRTVIICNESEVSRHEDQNRFSANMDPRDHVLLHPFNFQIQLKPDHFSQSHESHSKEKNLFKSEGYLYICELMQDYLVRVCQNVISVGFNYLNAGKLLQNQSKDFTAKNILLNVKSVVSAIVYSLTNNRIIKKEETISDIKLDLTKRVDSALIQILRGLAPYYPQAPPSGGTPKMREALSSINRAEDQQFQFTYANDIRITSEQMKQNQYTSYIMRVINKAIQITSQVDPKDPKGRTMFQKYTQFCQNIFWMTQNDTINKMSQLGVENIEQMYISKTAEYIEKIICQNSSIMIKQIVDELQNIQLPEKIKKNKQIQSSLLTQVFRSAENGIQQMKKQNSYAIGQKIPSYVKSFTQNQLKEKQFTSKSSAILRILTKWAQYLEEIFDNPDKAINQRVYPFKTTSNKTVNNNKYINQQLLIGINKYKKIVDDRLDRLTTDNSVFQSQFLSQNHDNNNNRYAKRFSDTRQTASKINAVMIRLMVQHINTLISYLNQAGRNIQVQFQDMNINLVSFKIGDLMRSRIKCSQSGFLRLMKFLYLMDEKDNRSFFKLVRIKNKLDSRDNNVLINFMFLGKVQCQMQISVQSSGGKQKNYYSFSHFIYELTRGRFGSLTQCSVIIAQHDPIVADCKGNYYEPKKKKVFREKQEENDSKESIEYDKRSENSITISNANKNTMFICYKCRKLILHERESIFIKDQLPNPAFYTCSNCILSQGAKTNKSSEDMLCNREIGDIIDENIKVKLMIKIQNYNVQEWSKQVYTEGILPVIQFRSRSKLPELWHLWQHQSRPVYFMVRINNYKEKLSEQLQYQQVTKQVLNQQKIQQLTYLVTEDINSEFQQIIKKISGVNLKDINVETIFNYMEEMCNRKIAVDLFASKSEVLSVYSSPKIIFSIESYCEERQEITESQSKRIKRLYANDMKLGRAPHIVINWTHLKIISLLQNDIKQINLSKHKQLKELYLTDNQIQSIDLNCNINLTKLFMDSNQLNQISLQNLIRLKYLNLADNNLKTLNVEKNLKLRELNIIDNKFEFINVRQNIQLTVLYFATNKIKTVDIKNNIKLVKFNAYCNDLSLVDFSYHPQLQWVRISKNVLQSVDFKNNSKLTYIDLKTNAYLSRINLPNQPFLKQLQLSLDMNSEIDDVILDGVNEQCSIGVSTNSSTLIGKITQKYPQLMIQC